MFIANTILRERLPGEKPIRVGMIGAGYMGRGIALQILKYTPALRLAAIANRHLDPARRAYTQAGITDAKAVQTPKELDAAVSAGRCAVTEHPDVLCEAEQIDLILEVTGTIDVAAHAVLKAFEHGKQVILMNSELDATLGPILKVYADQAGVIYSNCDGDQPGVIMNLYRFVKGMGFTPVLLGNIKGLHDPYRTPETQKGYAEKFHQKPQMVTSFADGTKIAMEMAVVANATGFHVGRRGMTGPVCDGHITRAPALFPLDDMLRDGGWVDYVVGAQPAGGIFVLGYNEDPVQQQYLKYYKMGDGPVYTFRTPFHLCHFEAAFSIARVAMLKDPVMTPIGPPVVDVLTAAKRDLKAGETLDGMGGFCTYGLADNAAVCFRDNLLPMGLADGCRLKRDIPKDTVIACEDIDRPADRLSDRLRDEQNRRFAGALSKEL